MSLEIIKKNIAREKELVKRLEFLVSTDRKLAADDKNKKNIKDSIQSTEQQIKILNDSLPGLLKEIKLTQPLKPADEKPLKSSKDEIITVSHKIGDSERLVGIKKKDKQKYLTQLHIAESALKKLKKDKIKEKDEIVNVYKKANKYVKLSNQFFSRTASDLVDKGTFNALKKSLRKGNFMFLTNSYVSMMFFSTLLSVFFGILLMIFFIFFSISLEAPFIYLVDFAEISIWLRLAQVSWIVLIVPLVTFFTIYFYPSAEANSLKQKIDYEIPFAAIQMSAIAGANIEPSNIFRIIALSKEYPHVRNEAKKLMNQINLYGYDLSTALRNIAATSPSKEWSDLLNGIATTIKSGGNLSKYLDKKAESLLFNYRIAREKATKSAETFMDIYISVVIAAPMLMMLLLIMINISNLGFNVSVRNSNRLTSSFSLAMFFLIISKLI